jgi:tRNA pseudouridine55 synthase
VAERFVGDIEQVPPMVSAVKIGGRRLHQLARQGEEVERPARPVTVHRLDVGPSADGEPGVFAIAVECSSGTYVRTLAADIGTALGGGAHLRALRRTSVGSFTVAEARPLDEVDVGTLLSAAAALRDYPSVTVGPDVAAAVAHGKVLPRHTLGVSGDDVVQGPWAVLDESGALLAVYRAHKPETAKPEVVVTPA